jgi:glyoxylate reductase
MSEGRVFVTRRIPEAGLRLLSEGGARVTVGQSDDERGIGKADVIAGVRAADVLLSLLTEPVDREVMIANPRLLGVANCAVGFNNIDVAVATELGIPVSNTPGVLTDTTADLTWALILAVARRIPEAHSYMASGRYKIWGPNLLLGADVSPGGNGRRKVLGIVGYGRIGAAVARRAVGFDMEVLAYDPHNGAAIAAGAAEHGVRAVGLEELLSESDFVSLHPVLTPETRHMIGVKELDLMKRSAYLINVARGPVVDEVSLVEALRTQQIAGAALDVYEDEPSMAAGLAELAECGKVVFVPHIASASQDTRDKMATMAATNALAFLGRRRGPNVINPEVYETAAYGARARPGG